MAMLLGLVLLAAPLAAVIALVGVIDRRQACRHAETARQIALTDALHARLGAVVAPFVRWRRRRWEVAIAVPFERPEVVAGVLTTVDAMFGRAAWELVLRRQAAPAPQPRAQRTAPLGEESLSWT